MIAPIPPLTIRRGRGNPNWGKTIPPIPALLTEFEIQVEPLGLSRAEYQDSAELRRWCERNRNRCYVPEWLLKEWKMQVEMSFSWVA
jgi:hypothetical protein